MLWRRSHAAGCSSVGAGGSWPWLCVGAPLADVACPGSPDTAGCRSPLLRRWDGVSSWWSAAASRAEALRGPGCTSLRSTRRSPRRVGSGCPSVAVEQLALHGRPERLHHRVVDARGDPAHRAEQAGFAQPVPEDPGRVLRAAVGVHDRAGSVGAASGPSAGRRRPARCGCGRRSTSPRSGGRRRRGRRSSRPCRRRRVLGDVGAPEPVRRRRRTGADQVVVRGRRRCRRRLRRWQTRPGRRPHQPGDPLAAARTRARGAARRAPAARRRCHARRDGPARSCGQLRVATARADGGRSSHS